MARQGERRHCCCRRCRRCCKPIDDSDDDMTDSGAEAAFSKTSCLCRRCCCGVALCITRIVLCTGAPQKAAALKELVPSIMRERKGRRKRKKKDSLAEFFFSTNFFNVFASSLSLPLLSSLFIVTPAGPLPAPWQPRSSPRSAPRPPPRSRLPRRRSRLGGGAERRRPRSFS